MPDGSDDGERLVRNHSKLAAPIAHDAQEGEWSRKRLIKMNARFCERMEDAIAAGDEPSAVRQLAAGDTSGRGGVG
jgi:hypothetical protein